MKQSMKILLFIIFVFGTLLSCGSNQSAKDDRVYNSLESISLLNIPKEFLPSAGNCKVWFPDYTIDKQPFSASCKSNFMESKISQIIVKNEGTKESPMYSVMEMIKAKEGFSVRTLYFSDRVQ